MIKFKSVVIILFILFNMTKAHGFNYEKQQIDKHVVHIVSINPKEYHAAIVKANGMNLVGRETVDSIAKRFNAEIAINGGFFEIGASNDGKPCGTLVVQGNKYTINNKIEPLLVINDGIISIALSKPTTYMTSRVSMLSGIPLLIKDGKIFNEIRKKNSEFYTSPHARTAIGVKPDGTVVLVVVEHNYSRDLLTITLGEIKSLINTKGNEFAKQYNKKKAGDISIDELSAVLRDEFLVKGGSQGMAIVELAQMMKKLGCKQGINLDGGGSTTLWIKGKIVNKPIGDTDEGNGRQTTRSVSNAIIFTKN